MAEENIKPTETPAPATNQPAEKPLPQRVTTPSLITHIRSEDDLIRPVISKTELGKLE